MNRAFVALTRNFVRSAFRNRTATIFTLGLAFLFMALFGTLLTGAQGKETIGIVNDDANSAKSQALIAAIKAAPGASVETGSLETEKERLKNNQVDAVVAIPAGFDAAVQGGASQVTVTVFQASATNQAAAATYQIVTNIVSTMTKPKDFTAAAVVKPNIEAVNQLTAMDYFLPSMIGYIVLQSGINYVAISLVELRVRKVLRRLRSTPLRPATILAAQVVGGMVTVLMQIVVLIIVGRFLFGAHNYGNWLITAVPILLGTAAFVGIGFLITSAARTSESARALATMIALPMMFLTGIFFPITALPAWMQTLVHVLPLTWLNDALHQVMNDGAGLGTIAVDCLVLTGWAVVTLAVATWRFRWD